MSGTVVMFGIPLAMILIAILIYNNLISKKNQVDNAFAAIDAMLKKRYDLIPNLVASVKQYMQHEAGVLERLTALRSRAISGNLSTDQAIATDNEITGVLRSIYVSMENYPQLRASENFQNLDRTLNETEEQISAARRAFNAAVTDYNNGLEMFPSSIFASFMNLKRKPVFVISKQERSTPQVAELFK